MTGGGTLRDQQTEFTKQLLIEAARKVIMGNDLEDFSMQKVAEEAGVSHRTVYRYFPSRQALIDEFSAWVEANLHGPLTPEEFLMRRPLDVRPIFDRFDMYSEYFETAARIASWNLRPASQLVRDEKMREWFDEQFPDLDPYAADKAFAVVRHLVGVQSWITLRDRFGFEDGDVGEAIAWAIDELMNGLRAGRAPKQPARKEGSHATTEDE